MTSPTFSKEQKTLVITIFVLLCTLGAYSVLFWYLSQNAKEVSKLAAEVNSIDAQSANVADVRGLLTRTESDRQLLNLYFTPESSMVDLISSMENYAQIYDVELDIASVSTMPREELSTIKILEATLDISGKYSNILSFLSLLEKGQKAIKIETLALNSLDGGWNAVVHISSPITLYVPTAIKEETQVKEVKITSTSSAELLPEQNNSQVQ